MPGLGTLLFGPTEEEQRRKRAEFDALVQRNPELAPTAKDYNDALTLYMRSSRVPEERITTTPAEGPVTVAGVGPAPIEENRPIRLGTRVFRFNQDTGQEGETTIPESARVLNYRPSLGPGDPMARALTTINPETGEQIVIPIVTDVGRGTRVGTRIPGPKELQMKKKSGPARGRTPQEAADLTTIRNYEVMQRMRDFVGEPIQIPEEITAEYLAARERLELPPLSEPLSEPRGEFSPLPPEKMAEYLRKKSGPSSIRDFPSIEAAGAAKLPKGTIVTINGRRAIVE